MTASFRHIRGHQTYSRWLHERGDNYLDARRPVAEPLRGLVEKIREKGSIPIITGYSRQLPNRYMTADKLAGRDRADFEARAIATQMKVQFADLGVAGPVEIVDRVHPTQAYSLRLTMQLIAALDKVAPECSFNSENIGALP